MLLYKFMVIEEKECPPHVKNNARLLKLLALLALTFLVYLMWAADSGNLPRPALSIVALRHGDKIAHFALYGIVASLLSTAFPRTLPVWRWRIPLVSLAFLLFALGEEWSQALFPRRTSDLLDGLCSALGIILGTWIAMRYGKKKASNTPSN